MNNEPVRLDALAAWSHASADWVSRLDDQCFPRLFDRTLRQFVRFDLSVAFAYTATGPMLLHDGLRSGSTPVSMRAYLGGAYLLDPFYLACATGRSCGLYRMREIAPDAYANSEYFKSPAVHPCISMESGSLAEEIAFLFRLPGGVMAAFSLMRGCENHAFDDREIAMLRAVEPVIRAALQHHWRGVAPSADRADAREGASLAGTEHAFARLADDRLTAQQQRIVQLLLRGHSSASVARQLGITEGTAKNHRHAIYERLGIGSQSELFSLFVRHLAS